MKQLYLIMLMVFVYATSAYSYSPDPPNAVHQYITNESKSVWQLLPYEIKLHSVNSLDNQLQLFGVYDFGDDIITGSGEEDRPPTNTLKHLWNPDNPDRGNYDDGVYESGSAYQKALTLWKTKVIPLYLKGELNESYYWLGRVAHLLEDQSVPAHAHNEPHAPGIDSDTFENYAKTVFTNYTGLSYTGKFYYYENLPNITASNWSEVDANDKDNIELFRLFWFTAQRAQYFASKQIDGNSVYVTLLGETKTFNPSLWSGETVNLTANTTGQVFAHLDDISNAEIPHAMRAVAGLYRLFWDAVRIDWPTNRHDNRRTGVTLLKGDMKKASEVDNLNLFLTSAQNQEYVIRSSIADLDNNGYMEAVSVAHEKYDAVIGNLGGEI